MWKWPHSFTLLNSFLSIYPLKKKKGVCPKVKYFTYYVFLFPFSPVFDLLPSSSQRLNPGALRPILTDPTLNELYVISTFKLQSKSSATILGLYSSTDNSKYFEFTVMGRLNKGKHICRNRFLKNPLFLCQDLSYTFLKMVPLYSSFFSSTIYFSFKYQILLTVHLPIQREQVGVGRKNE